MYYLKEQFMPGLIVNIPSDNRSILVDENISNEDFIYLIKKGYSDLFDFSKRLSLTNKCVICGKNKKLTEFNKTDRHTFKYCKECQYKKNKENSKKRELKIKKED